MLITLRAQRVKVFFLPSTTSITARPLRDGPNNPWTPTWTAIAPPMLKKIYTEMNKMLQLSPERKHYDVQTCSQVEGYHKKSHANSMQKKTQERVSIFPPPSFAAHRCILVVTGFICNLRKKKLLTGLNFICILCEKTGFQFSVSAFPNFLKTWFK